MSAQKTLEALKEFCTKNSGDALGQVWHGNRATYRWNLGKTTVSGEVNGVVRKLAGIDASGQQIWVVAGSFKLSPYGSILRFTGLPKRLQSQVLEIAKTPIVSLQQNSVKV